MILKVKFTKPEGASIDDVVEFVHDALTTWGGQRHPSDPLFHSLAQIEWIEVHGKRFKPSE